MADERPSPTNASDEPVSLAGLDLHTPWTVVLLAVVLAAVGLAVSQLLPWAAFRGLDAAGASLPSLASVALQLVLTELVGFGGMAWLYLRLRGLPRDYVHLRWPTRRDAAWVVGGTLLVVVLYYLVVVVAVLAGVEISPTAIGEYGRAEPRGLLLIAALSVVLVGPMEELFFRGIVQETMREALPSRLAIPLASATFALVHLITLRGPPLGQAVLVGSLFLTTLVMGYAYERTRNLAVNAAIHGGYNAVLLLLAYAVITSGMAPT